MKLKENSPESSETRLRHRTGEGFFAALLIWTLGQTVQTAASPYYAVGDWGTGSGHLGPQYDLFNSLHHAQYLSHQF